MENKSRRIYFKTEETVKTTKVGYMEVDMDFRKLYSNAWKFTAQLGGVCSRDFLLWILGKIDDNNVFVYSRSLYREFINDLELNTTGRIYEENTVQLALREFLEKNIAWKISRGVYQINPAIFTIDQVREESPEAKVIKQLIQNQSNNGENLTPTMVPEKNVIEYIPAQENIPDKFSGSLFSFESFLD